MSNLPRTLEPEVMDTAEEAVDYDTMDHNTVNQLFVADLCDFIATTESRQPKTVLDLGTGTAQIPLRLLQSGFPCRSLLACDLSMEMLRIACRRIQSTQHFSQILPVYCDAKRIPVANHSCDAVISNSIAHHIPEPQFVFAETRRVLRADGIVFMRDLLRPQDDARVEHLVDTYTGHENAHQRQLFRQSLHAALTVAEVRNLLANEGLDPTMVRQTSDRHWTIAGRITRKDPS